MRSIEARGAAAGALLCVLVLLGCGATLPVRAVIEHDLGDFAYRRYQKSYDIEVPIAGNQATGHTASYLRRDAAGGVGVATAFVTIYARAKSLAAEARNALGKLGGYEPKPTELEGEWVWVLDAEGRERWCVWVSGKRLVKIGVQPGQPFPEPLLAAYLELYPSDLNEHGAAREGAASSGKAKLDGEQD